MNMRLLRLDYVASRLCTLTLTVFRFNQSLFLLVLLISSSLTSPVKQPLSPSSDSFADLVFSDSNDRNTIHNNQQPGTSDQQVLYINHGNGAISSIRRSLRQPVTKLPFKPHVTSYPSSPFDNNNSDVNLEPVPLIGNYPDSAEDPVIPINPSRYEEVEPSVDQPPSSPISIGSPNRRPSRRSTQSDVNTPSRIIYDPQPSLSQPPPPPSSVSSQPSLPPSSPPPSLTTLNPVPPSTHRPSRISDPFIPFNFDNIFTRDPTFDIERNVIGGNQRNPPPLPLPLSPASRPSSSLSSHRNHFQNENNVEASPLHGSQPSTSPGEENDINRLNKPELVKINEDDPTNVEPRVRKQITGPPSAYGGRSDPPITTPSPPLLGSLGGPTGFGPTLGSVDGNGFIPSYGPPGFGLPGAQDIFPFFETPFLPINPTSSANGGQRTPHGFQRRRLTNNHNHNNLGAYGNPNHHTSSPPPPVNNLNDNSIGNGYPSYNIYKGGDDDDAGVKWPKIFKFTDGRVNLSEFERNKKSGKIKFLNKEDAHFADVRRDSFLILHGGAYN
uniref:Uncharacterized protein n=1 Tax=Tetranychus urticae TaxID=32264 RepID=T1KV49_TETUR